MRKLRTAVRLAVAASCREALHNHDVRLVLSSLLSEQGEAVPEEVGHCGALGCGSLLQGRIT
jgi:hypothetical protein